MNYIKRLEAENAELREKVAAFENHLNNFKASLSGPKYTGTDAEGDRKDWISTRDVADYIDAIRASVEGF